MASSNPSMRLSSKCFWPAEFPARTLFCFPRTVENTFDEAQALADYLDHNPDCSVSVVTTSWHTRRARWTFDKALEGRSSQIHFVAAPTERFDENNWWTTEEGIFIVNEYIKLGYYCLKY